MEPVLSRYVYPGLIYLAAAVVLFLRGDGPLTVWPPSAPFLSGALLVLASIWWSVLAASDARPARGRLLVAALPMVAPVAMGAMGVARDDNAWIGIAAMWWLYGIPVAASLVAMLVVGGRSTPASDETSA